MYLNLRELLLPELFDATDDDLRRILSSGSSSSSFKIKCFHYKLTESIKVLKICYYDANFIINVFWLLKN